MEFNQEQAMKTIRWFIATFGSGIVGFAAGRGWVDADLLTSLLNSEVVIGALASIGMMVWSWLSGRKKSQVASVAAMPEVKAVVVEPTPAGAAIADRTPDNVVSAGTSAATNLAKAA